MGLLPDFPRVIALVETRRAVVLDQLVGAVLEAIPRYELLSGVELRDSLGGLLDALLAQLRSGDRTLVRDRLQRAAERRVMQGFNAADYLRVLFVVPQTVMNVVRRGIEDEVGRDADVEAELARFSAVLQDAVGVAGNAYVDQLSHRLSTKNAELNRLNQQLVAQQRALAREVDDAHFALAETTELNRRVIESLSSGLMVTERGTKTITLFSGRMEEITGVPTEEALGRHVADVFAGFEGIDVASAVDQVTLLGSLPLTKMHITVPSGRKKTVYVRAETLRAEDGTPMGSVVVVDDVSERELLLDSFSRYVSRDLVKRLLARAEPMGLEGERRNCTILFADVRGFTTLAEGQAPEDLHRLLNVYFHLMIEAILSEGGFIDKFVGDKVMALFTNSAQDVDNAAAALRAALKIKGALRALNEERRASGAEALEIGIGVNTGEVLLGNIGSDQRMEFTAIGDPVNVADRLQHMARHGEVLVGGSTSKLVAGLFALVDRGEQEVRGRAAPEHVYELVVR